MTEIADSFSGYLKIDDDTYAYSFLNHIVTLLPAQSEQFERHEILERMRARKINSSEYLFGNDGNGAIAMLQRGKFNCGIMGFDSTANFATPIVIKATGNTAYFYSTLTKDWDVFHAITFYGGNINAIYNPQIAIEQSRDEEYNKNNGAREIRIRPWTDYTRSVDFTLDGETVKLTISIMQKGGGNNKEQKGAWSLGELNSFIRFSFENAQHFDKIEKYYKIVKSLIALLTKQNNIFFEVDLRQRNKENLFFKTGICKIFDRYENYSTRTSYNVISLYNIFDYLPELINKIIDNDVESILTLLPEDNRKTRQISITNVQDLCTALEIAYGWNKRSREKDGMIVELKKKIQETISEFIKNHEGVDVYQSTTMSSAFQYLDYTLKKKILTLYEENCNIVDAIISKWALPQVNEDSVGSFVKLRNKKTHSGTVEWGESADLYTVFLALLYVCIFKSVGMPEEMIKQEILQLF